MKNITLAQLKKELNLKSREDLQADIELLFKQFLEVKKHYTMLCSNNGIDEVLEESKQKIYKEFHGGVCPKARISVAKKAITDFKKLPVTDENIIGLMLCYVEEILYFIREYGAGYDTNYPDSSSSMFESAVKLIKKNNLQEKYQDTLQKIIKKADDAYVEDFDWVYDKYIGEK